MNKPRSVGWIVLVVACTSAGAGCNNSAPPSTPPTPPEVFVAEPLQLKITDYDTYEGRVASREIVEIRSRVTGYLDKVAFKEGEEVKVDQLLFQIDDRTFDADVRAAKARSDALVARTNRLTADLARADKLRSTPGALSREEYDKIVGDLAESKGQLRSTEEEYKKANLYLGFTKIDSPIAGRIGRAEVTEGNLVTADMTILATVVSVDPMYVEFDIDERSLLRYKKNYNEEEGEQEKPVPLKEQKIPMFVGLEGEVGYPHEGILYDASNRLNQSTGTIQVRGELNNPKRILEDGMRARVHVPVSDPYSAILIPNEAVGADQQRRYVYVVDAKNIAKRQQVKLGGIREGFVIVEEGLKPTDRVIVRGIQFVRPESPVDPKPTKLEVPAKLQEKPKP